MRTGITFEVSPPDRLRLERVVRDRNAAQKHVWRASIILLPADGVGTATIMRQKGKSKTCVWRRQERFAQEGFEGVNGGGIPERKHAPEFRKRKSPPR
jgi:hypothetical protein